MTETATTAAAMKTTSPTRTELGKTTLTNTQVTTTVCAGKDEEDEQYEKHDKDYDGVGIDDGNRTRVDSMTETARTAAAMRATKPKRTKSDDLLPRPPIALLASSAQPGHSAQPSQFSPATATRLGPEQPVALLSRMLISLRICLVEN